MWKKSGKRKNSRRETEELITIAKVLNINHLCGSYRSESQIIIVGHVSDMELNQFIASVNRMVIIEIQIYKHWNLHKLPYLNGN